MVRVKIANLKTKIKASILVETIVAMLLITISFTMAFMVILNVSKNSNNSLKTKAYILSNDVLVKTKSEKQYFDQDFVFGNITVKRTITEYENNEELFQLNLSTFDYRNHKLFEQNELIIIEQYEY